jgi:heavy metal efflux system protein
LLLRLHGTEIERPLAIVMIGGLLTSTVFTLLVLPTVYIFVHSVQQRIVKKEKHEAMVL